jgi:hypothetical protein
MDWTNGVANFECHWHWKGIMSLIGTQNLSLRNRYKASYSISKFINEVFNMQGVLHFNPPFTHGTHYGLRSCSRMITGNAHFQSKEDPRIITLHPPKSRGHHLTTNWGQNGWLCDLCRT